MDNLFLKKARFVLYPVSVVYGAAVRFRHWLYDKGLRKSTTFNFPVICVGNLALGGTGKSPMTEYLIRLLKDRYKVAALSRGYKRKTKGYARANEFSTAIDIGDEPMQFHEKFPEITVAVAEERADGIPQILFDEPETEVIILDDAMQHRPVNAGFNILLTEHDNLFSDDHLFPAGNLRDIADRSKVADCIVVTKCPQDLTSEQAKQIKAKLSAEQPVFFSALHYSAPVQIFTGKEIELTPDTDVLVISGIANPRHLAGYLRTKVRSYALNKYADHYIYTSVDLKAIRKDFEAIDSPSKLIITTEKDAVRLKKFKAELGQLPIYALPIQHQFLFESDKAFNAMVIKFVEGFKKMPA